MSCVEPGKLDLTSLKKKSDHRQREKLKVQELAKRKVRILTHGGIEEEHE